MRSFTDFNLGRHYLHTTHVRVRFPSQKHRNATSAFALLHPQVALASVVWETQKAARKRRASTLVRGIPCEVERAGCGEVRRSLTLRQGMTTPTSARGERFSLANFKFHMAIDE
jgi:hypothetical protein